MHTTGSFILLFAIGLLVVISTNSVADMFSEVNDSNDTELIAQAEGGETTTTSLLTMFGYGVLIIGAVVAINAFR